MATEHFTQFVLLVSIGLGMLLAGGITMFQPRVPRSIHAVACASAVVLAYLIADTLAGQTHLATRAAGLTALIIGANFVAGSGRIHAWVAALSAILLKPRARWGTLAALGMAVVLGSVVAYERADQTAIDQSMRELDLEDRYPLCVAARARAFTDRGIPVELKIYDESQGTTKFESAEDRFLSNNPLRLQIIRRQPAATTTNCHGWVFTGGQYWIGGLHVDTILNDNGYVPVTDPHPGDLAIYRSPAGVAHTAVVRYVAENSPVMVEGKWGMQGVYLHAVEDSCYGKDVTFYRSERRGHLLQGVGAAGSPRPYDEPAAE